MNKKPHRIIFMGTPQFAVPSFLTLLAHNENVVAVVTQPDRPKGRGRKLISSPVKQEALAADIPLLTPASIKTDEFFSEISAYQPDIIIVAAYGRILPDALLALPEFGAINVHGSLLPKYRGAAPVQWAIINGEKETGVTIMQIDAGLDTGDIMLYDSLPITDTDTSSSLSVKMAVLGSRLLIKTLAMLREDQGSAVKMIIKQNDSYATLAPPLTKQQGLIDWTLSACAISCLIRGLDPWGCAYTNLHNKRLRLFAPSVITGQVSAAPGVVCRADAGGLLIATGQNYLLVKKVQLAGARRMGVADFLRGYPLDGIKFHS